MSVAETLSPLSENVLVRFADSLRQAGIPIGTASVIDFCRGVKVAGIANCYWVGRATLVNRPEQTQTYDQIFSSFWQEVLTESELGLPQETSQALTEIILGFDSENTLGAESEFVADIPVLAVRWSAVETLRFRDFRDLEPAEMDLIADYIQDFGQIKAQRKTLRSKVAKTGRLDMRSTIRSALRNSGEVREWKYRALRKKPRRVVILCDVSGSMLPYTDPLLRVLYAGVAGVGQVEAFTLGTRLTRLTKTLIGSDPSAALRRATQKVEDISGGTRLGDCLRTFNQKWGRQGMARGAVVVVISDGWDRGDPDVLHREMDRLSRSAHHIVWVNPLLATEDFAPTAGGMATALLFVDDFLAGNSLAALDEVVAAIGKS